MKKTIQLILAVLLAASCQCNGQRAVRLEGEFPNGAMTEADSLSIPTEYPGKHSIALVIEDEDDEHCIVYAFRSDFETRPCANHIIHMKAYQGNEGEKTVWKDQAYLIKSVKEMEEEDQYVFYTIKYGEPRQILTDK